MGIYFSWNALAIDDSSSQLKKINKEFKKYLYYFSSVVKCNPS